MQTTGVSSGTVTGSLAGQRGLGSMKSEDFFRILVTELQQQDPFEPAKTSDMISQVAQIRDIELSGRLTGTLDKLTQQQRAIGSGELIGKYVYAQIALPDGTLTRAEGVVTGVRFDSDGAAVLELDTGQAVPVSAVQRVTTIEQAMAEQATAAVGAAQPPTDRAAGETIKAGTSRVSGTAVAEDRQAASKASRPQKPWWLEWLNVDASLRW